MEGITIRITFISILCLFFCACSSEEDQCGLSVRAESKSIGLELTIKWQAGDEGPKPIALEEMPKVKSFRKNHVSTGTHIQVLDKNAVVLFERSDLPNLEEAWEKIYAPIRKQGATEVQQLYLKKFFDNFQFKVEIPRFTNATKIRLVQERQPGPTLLETLSPQVFDFDLASILRSRSSKVAHTFGSAIEKIHFTGQKNNRLNIVLLPDGYRSSELDQFREESEQLASHFLSQSPYREYANSINIWRVLVASHDSGASCDDGTDHIRDNAFGSSFPVACLNAKFGTSFGARAPIQENSRAVDEIIESLKERDDEIFIPFILINSSKRGGSAIFYATKTNSTPTYIFPHEFSHVFGNLADEYINDVDPCFFFNFGKPNISFLENKKAAVKWHQWIENETPIPTPDTDSFSDKVGLFQGASNCSYFYRPARTCKMADERQDFCSVCREQLVLRLYDIVRPFDGPLTAAHQRDGSMIVDASIVAPSNMASRWFVDGKVVQENSVYNPLHMTFTPGSHQVSLQLKDATEFVRKDRCHLMATQDLEVIEN